MRVALSIFSIQCHLWLAVEVAGHAINLAHLFNHAADEFVIRLSGRPWRLVYEAVLPRLKIRQSG